MKILVTGASGFIGGRFARHALEQGLEVRASDLHAAALEPLRRLGAHCVEADLNDADQARRLCMGVEAVVHCAGRQGHWGRYQDFHQANVDTTENIVEACLKEHVRRLVYLSSAALYSALGSARAHKENQVSAAVRGHAGRTRYLAEQKVFGAAEFGLETLALRPAQVLGAGDRSFMPKWVRLQRKQRLAIVGNGLNTVDFTSIHNLNRALSLALLVNEQGLGKAYNVSNGTPLPMWDVINYVMRQLHIAPVTRYRSLTAVYTAGLCNEAFCSLWPGRPQPTWSRSEARQLQRSFTLDIHRARHYLDYQPQVSLWAAADEFCAWWQALETNSH